MCFFFFNFNSLPVDLQHLNYSHANCVKFACDYESHVRTREKNWFKINWFYFYGVRCCYYFHFSCFFFLCTEMLWDFFIQYKAHVFIRFPIGGGGFRENKGLRRKKKRLKEQNSIFLNIKYYMCAFTMRLNKQKIVGNFAITSVGGEKKKSGQFHWKYNKQVLNQTRSITKQALNVKYANMKKIKCIFLIAMLCSATRLVNAFQLRYCWWWTKTTPETTNGFICYDVTYHRCWDAHS